MIRLSSAHRPARGRDGRQEKTAGESGKRPAILFDLDGTLVDTAPDLHAALNVSLEKNGLPLITKPEEMNDLIGGGVRKLISASLDTLSVEEEDALLKKMEEDFLDHYSLHLADQSRPFEGVERSLANLRRRGFALGVCTNKREDLARALLRALQLDDFFGEIRGGDRGAHRKPDPQPLLESIKLLKADKKKSVMVGDSIMDSKAAQAAGLPVIITTFGYSQEPVETLGANALMDSYDELEGLLEKLLAPTAS